MKQCKKCEELKNITEFQKKSGMKDGHSNSCKSCTKIYNNSYYKNNYSYFEEKRDEWNKENREYRNECARNNYHNNKEYYSSKSKEYRSNNREKLLENKREWDKKRSIDEKRKYRNKYALKKKKEDSVYNLKCLMRSYVSSTLKSKGYKKKLKTIEILGCSFNDFKIYLESKFEPWMTWENKGLYNGEINYGWDIDHIIPLSKAKTEDDVIKLNHYTNLQPLCSKLNRDIKKSKVLL
jgi:hypothetical protein